MFRLNQLSATSRERALRMFSKDLRNNRIINIYILDLFESLLSRVGLPHNKIHDSKTGVAFYGEVCVPKYLAYCTKFGTVTESLQVYQELEACITKCGNNAQHNSTTMHVDVRWPNVSYSRKVSVSFVTKFRSDLRANVRHMSLSLWRIGTRVRERGLDDDDIAQLIDCFNQTFSEAGNLIDTYGMEYTT